MAKLSRSPYKPSTKSCEQCSRPWQAFRKTTRFCSDRCRWVSHYGKSDRAIVLNAHGHYCDTCQVDGRPTKQGQKLFVYLPKDNDGDIIHRSMVFCSYHRAVEIARVRKYNARMAKESTSNST